MNVNLSERFTWILIGAVIGFILGYTTRYLQTRRKKSRSEAGFIRLPLLADVKAWFVRSWHRIRSVRLRSWTMALIVLICSFASFQTQQVNNDVRANDAKDNKQQDAIVATQAKLEKISTCNSDFLASTIAALNERTTYSTDQADANVDLQKQQLKLLIFAFTIPPPSAQDGRAAFGAYIERLNRFVELAKKTAGKAEDNPYPTLTEFSDCVNKEVKVKK